MEAVMEPIKESIKELIKVNEETHKMLIEIDRQKRIIDMQLNAIVTALGIPNGSTYNFQLKQFEVK